MLSLNLSTNLTQSNFYSCGALGESMTALTDIPHFKEVTELLYLGVCGILFLIRKSLTRLLTRSLLSYNLIIRSSFWLLLVSNADTRTVRSEEVERFPHEERRFACTQCRRTIWRGVLFVCFSICLFVSWTTSYVCTIMHSFRSSSSSAE